MKGLLLAIRDRLQTIDGIQNSNVFLSPDPDIIPDQKTFPAIGIKDGQVTRSALSCGVIELTLAVEIYVYETQILGDGATLSVLDIAAAIHDRLGECGLDGYVKAVSPGRESPIRLLHHGGEMILRKQLDYVYEREEA